MKASPLPRKTANLSESIHQQLSMYAFAASAASVGMLALASPAEAKIVYTPANIKIVQTAACFTFDLNHDGIPDFALSNNSRHSAPRTLDPQCGCQARQANEIREGLPAERG